MIREQDQCKTCAGNKTTSSVCKLQVNIEKGMKENDRIVFRGSANEAPGMQPGDIVFVIKENKHEVLHRQGCDLVMQKKISLLQALTGVRFRVPHLDGMQLLITSSPEDVSSLFPFPSRLDIVYGIAVLTKNITCTCVQTLQVIAPGDVRAIVGKGMPIKGSPFMKGDLFIKFDVEFPRPGTLSKKDILV